MNDNDKNSEIKLSEPPEVEAKIRSIIENCSLDDDKKDENE